MINNEHAVSQFLLAPGWVLAYQTTHVMEIKFIGKKRIHTLAISTNGRLSTKHVSYSPSYDAISDSIMIIISKRIMGITEIVTHVEIIKKNIE